MFFFSFFSFHFTLAYTFSHMYTNHAEVATDRPYAHMNLIRLEVDDKDRASPIGMEYLILSEKQKQRNRLDSS